MNNLLLNAIKNYKVQMLNINNNADSKINKKVSEIYIINLEEDFAKRNYIIKLMQKYGINFKLIIVNRISLDVYRALCETQKITIGELGCCLSHMWCLYQILQNKHKNALIFEDDIILHKNFINKFLKIYIKNKDIDFLLLGAHDYMFAKYNYKNVKNELYKPHKDSKQLYGAHANYYSYNGAKRMFYIRITDTSFFDKEYMLMFNYLPNSYICYPNLAVSNVSSSTLNHSKPFSTNVETDYYEKCFINFNFNEYNYIYINILDNTIINLFVNYEAYIDKCLYNYFHDFDKIKEIKNRMVMDFFKIEDIKYILLNQSLIVPNNLSIKCIGENS